MTPMTIKFIQAQQSDRKLYDDCLFLHFLRSHTSSYLLFSQAGWVVYSLQDRGTSTLECKVVDGYKSEVRNINANLISTLRALSLCESQELNMMISLRCDEYVCIAKSCSTMRSCTLEIGSPRA